MTRTREGVPFLALVVIAAHLGDQIAQKNNFEDVNRHFPVKHTKCSYYENYCVDHNQILHNGDPPSTHCGWSKYTPNKSRWRHLEKLKKKVLISS